MVEYKIMVLGCGGSGGVPLATGYWGNCDPANPKNHRTRPAIAIQSATTTLIIDTGPDFRAQVNREGIDRVDAVLYTHDHADHVNGIDDLRYAAIHQRILGQADATIPFYTDKVTLESIQLRFPYLFITSVDGLYVPMLQPHVIQPGEVIIGDIPLTVFHQIHGIGHSLGIRLGDFAYSTDVSDLDEAAFKALEGIETWIVDCGQFGSDKTTVHPNWEKLQGWQDRVQAKQLYLTHMTPKSDYDAVNAATPDNVECAYDGLNLSVRG